LWPVGSGADLDPGGQLREDLGLGGGHRCQNPSPDKIRNSPAAANATIAAISRICPICHHP
jgi:hypothetical protein